MQYNRPALTACAVAILVGCATVPAGPNYYASKNPTATIYLYRPSASNIGGTPKIDLNGQIAGRVGNSQYLAMHVEPGDYYIEPVRGITWGPKCGKTFVGAKAGETTYVRMVTRVDFEFTPWSPAVVQGYQGCSMYHVDEAEALPEIEAIKNGTDKIILPPRERSYE